MNQQMHLHQWEPGSWCWPINGAEYDRSPALGEMERSALESVLSQPHSQIRKPTKAVLDRLVRPIYAALTYMHVSLERRDDILRVLLIEMWRSGVSFWAWSAQEWCEKSRTRRKPRLQEGGKRGHWARSVLPLVAYLLNALPDVGPLLEYIDPQPTAHKVFGKMAVDEAVQPILTILQGWGYRQKTKAPLVTCVCYLLLRNRSPHLSDLSIELLESVDQTCTIPSVKEKLYQVSRALSALGCTEKALPENRGRKTPVVCEIDGRMSEEWYAWCTRWRKQATLRRTSAVYYNLLKVGRWLKVHHPEITNPGQWTYELAAEFVAAVNDMKVGEWSAHNHSPHLPANRLGHPFRPAAKDKLLASMRTFLRDCQEREWIPIDMNPYRAFRTPRSIRSLIGPDPRVVEKGLWAKILWAAMNLEADDLPLDASESNFYPVEMVRAVAAVWCFAALRSDEIVRLRVGCVRWQYEDVMIPETGEMLPRDAVCFLDIPVNKTSTAYTKPVHPSVGKCINAWEQVRPREQPKAVDGTTSETVPLLFSYRGHRISKTYVNRALIPLLGRKAGVPIEDNRGKITSHRARATMASMLYNAKNPLDVFQIKQYLGHKHLSSTQNYLQVDPTKLAGQVAKAGYLEQNLATIEVLLDQEAVMNGAASRGESWKYYDLGHGWCTNPFWSACAHRMACAKCPSYRPKDSLKDQLIEGKANLVRMLEFVQLTEEEKLLVTEGIELHQELIEQLADVPTPAGPTPHELEQSRQPETKVIPLKEVRRNKKRQDEL